MGKGFSKTEKEVLKQEKISNRKKVALHRAASIQNISCDTFYDPDGTQPTGYVGQVSLNSIQ